ncbi:serine hydroxymethyltransferase [Kitasatospora sp. NPDC097643]|uniref:serine hydroxymethyltransferase n=1 Tax=Kitasatospora sp. NPDC097643 TaxID=3157230 RepID=UPI0033333AB6
MSTSTGVWPTPPRGPAAPSPPDEVSGQVGKRLAELAAAAPTLNLFPTENLLSPAALRALGSELGARYPGSEGEVFHYGDPYQLADLYALCAGLTGEYFEVRHAFVNLLSGLHAMQSMLTTFCKAGDRVLVMDPDGGGHYATARICHDLGYRVGHVPVDRTSLRIDTDRLAEAAAADPPNFVYLDLSTLLRLPRPAELRAAIGPDALLCLDASHILGLLPSAYGSELWRDVDLCSASTHKTFPGPQKAVLLTDRDDLAQRLDETLPFRVSSGHTGSVAALAVTLEELMDARGAYGRQIVANARAFAQSLAEEGLDVAGAGFGYTETHQVWVAPPPGLPHAEWGRRLLDAGVRSTTVPLPSHGRPGLRLGLQELTRAGAREDDARAAARLVARIVTGRLDPARGRQETGEFLAGLPGVTNRFGTPD